MYDGKSADVCSLGIVLHVMLAGAFPWEVASAQSQLYLDFISGAFQWNSAVPAACVPLLHQMLSPFPAQRASVTQVLSHPWVTQQQQPQHTPPPSAAYNLSINGPSTSRETLP